MLHALFVLLSLTADYETVRDIAQFAFHLGLAGASIIVCSGVLLAIRRWKLTGVERP